AIRRDAEGMQRLFRQFSTPGGVPSHVSVPTPGSIHEGGELGYVLVHAFGAAFDNPDLLAVAVIGDGEAETGPLEGSWKGIHFLDPERDGAVLPILHLNGYKISGPTVLGRERDGTIRDLLRGHGYDPHVVAGDDPFSVHTDLAETLDRCWARIREIQDDARRHPGPGRRRGAWPARVRAPRAAAGDRAPRVDAAAGAPPARRLPAERAAAELPPVLPRRDKLQPARRRLRGREPVLRRTGPRHRRSRGPRRPRHGGPE